MESKKGGRLTMGKVETNRSVIPQSCISFSEMADYVNEYSNEQYNKLIEAVGIAELVTYESTGAMVDYMNEAEDAETCKKYIREYFDNTWAAHKALWENVLLKVANNVNEGRKVAAVAESKTPNTEKSYGKLHILNMENTNYAENAKNFVSEAIKTFDALEEETDYRTALTMLNEAVTSFVSGLDTNAVDLRSDLKADIIKNIYEISGDVLAKQKDNLLECVNEGPVDEIKKAYNEEAAVFNMIKNEVLESANLDTCSKWLPAIKNAVNTMHTCYATSMDCVLRGYSESKNVLTKLARSVNEASDPIADNNDQAARDGKTADTSNVEGEKQEVMGDAIGSNSKSDPIADNNDQDARDGKESTTDTKNVEGEKQDVVGAALEANDPIADNNDQDARDGKESTTDTKNVEGEKQDVVGAAFEATDPTQDLDDAEARAGKTDNSGSVEGKSQEVLGDEMKGSNNTDPIADKCDAGSREGKVPTDTSNVEGEKTKPIGAAQESASYVKQYDLISKSFDF